MTKLPRASYSNDASGVLEWVGGVGRCLRCRLAGVSASEICRLRLVVTWPRSTAVCRLAAGEGGVGEGGNEAAVGEGGVGTAAGGLLALVATEHPHLKGMSPPAEMKTYEIIKYEKKRST